MDLALELGLTAGALKRSMTERELGQWVGYRRRRQLPQYRLELYLARVCLTIAQAMGASKAKLEDYIFDFDSTEPGEVDTDDVDVDQLKAELGFKPVARKHGP